MNATLTVGAAFGTVGMLLMPTVATDHVPLEIDWALHAAAPRLPQETLFPRSGETSMLVVRGNTFRNASAVFTASLKSEEWPEMSKRIKHLRTLSDGWVGTGSRAPSGDVLDWLAAHTSVFGSLRGASLIPLEDGSVALRWESGNCDLTAEVRPDHTLYTLVDDLDSDDVEENVEPLTDAALERFLSAHANA